MSGILPVPQLSRPPNGEAEEFSVRTTVHDSRADYNTLNSFLNLSTSFFAISAGEPSMCSVFFVFCGTYEPFDLLQVLANRRLHFR